MTLLNVNIARIP